MCQLTQRLPTELDVKLFTHGYQLISLPIPGRAVVYEYWRVTADSLDFDTTVAVERLKAWAREP